MKDILVYSHLVLNHRRVTQNINAHYSIIIVHNNFPVDIRTKAIYYNGDNIIEFINALPYSKSIRSNIVLSDSNIDLLCNKITYNLLYTNILYNSIIHYTVNSNIPIKSTSIKSIYEMYKLHSVNKYSKRTFSFISNNSTVQILIHNSKVFITSYILTIDMKNIPEYITTILSEVHSTYKEYEVDSVILIINTSSNTLSTIKNSFYDPRGYYTVSTGCCSIELTHYDVCGKKLRSFNNSDSQKLIDILCESGPSDLFHLSYITQELVKAEICNRLEIDYNQDTPID